jgi:hypothetical protein
MNELNILKLKDLMLRKEFINTQANHDLNNLGKFTADYIKLSDDLNKEIDRLILLIENNNSKTGAPPIGVKRPVGNISDSNIMVKSFKW